MTLSGDAFHIDPGEAATREFSRARKGYDPTEVRVHITRLTDEIRRLRGVETALETQVELARSQALDLESLDPATISRALGEETVRVIDAAREAATEIRSKAEENAGRLVREAQERASELTREAEELRARSEREAQELREDVVAEVEALRTSTVQECEAQRAEIDEYVEHRRRDIEAQAELADQNAEQVLEEAKSDLADARAEAAEIRAEAEVDAESIRREAEEARARRESEATEDADRIRDAAEAAAAAIREEAEVVRAAAEEDVAERLNTARADAEAEVERARAVARSMIEETQLVRERMIRDLAERRHGARQQLEATRAGRERLLAVFDQARASFDEIVEEVVEALPLARHDADAAARALPNDTYTSVEQLDRLIHAGASNDELFEGALADGGEAPEVDFLAAAGLASSDGSSMAQIDIELVLDDDDDDDDQDEDVIGGDEVDEVAVASAESSLVAEVDAELVGDEITEQVVEELAEAFVEVDAATVDADGEAGAGEETFEAEADRDVALADEHDDLDDELDDEMVDGEIVDGEIVDDLALSDEDEDEDEDPSFGRLRLVSSNQDGPSPVGIELLTDSEADSTADVGDEPAGEGEPGAVDAIFALLRADHDVDDDEDFDDFDDDDDDDGDDGDYLGQLDSDDPDVASDDVAALAAVASINGPAMVIDLAAAEQRLEQSEAAVAVAVLTTEQDRTLAQQALLDERDDAIGDLGQQIARRIRRVVSDQENEVLDLIRRNKKMKTAEQILPSAVEQMAAYRSAVAADLTAVLHAGVEFALDTWRPETHVDQIDVSAAFDQAVERLSELAVAPLTAKLARIIAEVDDPTPDRTDLVDAVRLGYREFKNDRIAEVAGDLVTVAFSRGVLAAAEPGDEVRWIVDHSGRACPDGEDNNLAGPTAAGEAFPTGDDCPPVHPGCRCLLVPAAR